MTKHVCLLFGCAVFWLCLTANRASSQPPPKDEVPLPEGLRHVPSDAIGFVYVRISDILQSDAGKLLLEKLQGDERMAKKMKTLEKELGLNLADVDSITVLSLENSVLPGLREFEERQKARENLKRLSLGVHQHQDIYKKLPTKTVLDPLLPYIEKQPVDGSPARPTPAVPDKKGGSQVPETKKEGKQSSLPAQRHEAEWVAFQAQPAVPTPRHEMPAQLEPPHTPLLIVTSSKPLDRKKLLMTHVLRRTNPADYSILFLSDRSLLIGQPAELVRYLDHPTKKTAPNPFPARLGPTPFRSILELGAQPHMIVAGFQVSPSTRQYLVEEEGPELAPLLPLLNAAAVGLTVDMGKSIDLKVHFRTSTVRSAALAQEAARCALVMMEIGLDDVVERSKKDKPTIAALAQKLRQSLPKATVEQKGTQVEVAFKVASDSEMLVLGVKQVIANIGSAANRTQSANNLKQLALAMHAYHDAYRHFPAAAITDKDGKPLLSWRVAILPFIEQVPLYEQFDLTKPWDHPHNKKLIAHMPNIYVLPGAPGKVGMTHYQVFVGPKEAAFHTPFSFPRTSLNQITDGTSNTIMIAEAANPVLWTKPDDLPFDPDARTPLPKLGGVFEGGFNVAMCDGSVRFLRDTIRPETLRALITMNGGEVVPVDD